MKIVIDIPNVMYDWVVNGFPDEKDVYFATKAIKEGIPLTKLTDTEQRIFLSAISREEKICRKIDEDKTYDADCKMLVPIVKSIERKVKKVLF